MERKVVYARDKNAESGYFDYGDVVRVKADFGRIEHDSLFFVSSSQSCGGGERLYMGWFLLNKKIIQGKIYGSDIVEYVNRCERGIHPCWSCQDCLGDDDVCSNCHNQTAAILFELEHAKM